MPADLECRDRQPEVMDDPAIPREIHVAALNGLARLNRFSGIAGLVWRELRPLAREADAPLCVLDIACGGGDLVAALGRRAAREGVPLAITGCDRSGTALAAAAARAREAGVNAEFFRADVVHDFPPGVYDAVMSHLFLHHLTEDAIVQFLANMSGSASRLVLVTDLVRGRRGYALAWAASRVLTRSGIVRTDALLSVRAALTPGELARCASRAGLTGARLRRIWPRRMLLTARTEDAGAR